MRVELSAEITIYCKKCERKKVEPTVIRYPGDVVNIWVEPCECMSGEKEPEKAVQKHVKLQLEGLDNHIGFAKKQIKHARKYSSPDLHNWQGYLSGLITAQVIIERNI